MSTALPNIMEVLDTAVKDITKRVAKFDMVPAECAVPDAGDSNSLVTTANGDYQLTIVFYAPNRVLQAITENMKRGKISDAQDIEIYTVEFFNILCGHVVTAMNNSIHASARFGIPRLVKGPYGPDGADPPGARREDLFYQSSFGPVQVSTIFQN